MKNTATSSTAKKAVNLSLNEGIVNQARALTNNLSAVVEQLLSDYIAYENQQAAQRAQALNLSIQAWNQFSEQHGSFADTHSTL